jgi:hypothetical protein
MSGHEVFIAYDEADSAVALGLAAELRSLGCATWTYEENGVAGFSYLEQVHAAIQKCEAFVLLASKASLQSHQVRREAEIAYENEKLIIPVRLRIGHRDIQNAPVFRMVSGTAVSIATDGSNLAELANAIAVALKRIGGTAGVTPSDRDTVTSAFKPAVRRTPAVLSPWSTPVAASVVVLAALLLDAVYLSSDFVAGALRYDLMTDNGTLSFPRPGMLALTGCALALTVIGVVTLWGTARVLILRNILGGFPRVDSILAGLATVTVPVSWRYSENWLLTAALLSLISVAGLWLLRRLVGGQAGNADRKRRR